MPEGKRSPLRDQPRNRHHRKPRSAKGDNDPSNISSVRIKDHIAYHRLFGPGLPQVVADILNEIWIDPNYMLVVRKRRKPRKKPYKTKRPQQKKIKKVP